MGAGEWERPRTDGASEVVVVVVVVDGREGRIYVLICFELIAIKKGHRLFFSDA